MRARSATRRLLVIGSIAVTVAVCGSEELSADSGTTGSSATIPTATEPSQTGSSPVTDVAAGEPQIGGTLTFLDSGTATTLDPATHPGVANGGYDAVAVFDVLVYETAGTGEIAYRLAESLESSDDLEWTLKLRANLVFTDGTPLDADAVKFNWERAADPALASMHAAAAQSITSMDVTDPLTLQISLAEANPQFARTVANELPFIGSPTAIAELGDQFGSQPVGAGPFAIESWTPGNELVLVRNPDYWNAPAPYLDKLILRGIVDPEQRYSTLMTGEAQMIGVEAAFTLVGRAEADGLMIDRSPASGALGIQLNLTKAPFDDLTARQALASAINRPGLIDTSLGGAVDPFTNLFSEQSPLYDDSVEWPQYDPVEAQRLLDEYAAAHGGPLEFSLFLPDFFSTYGEYLQTQLSEFENLSFDIELVSFDAFFPRLAGGDFQATIDSPGFVDPEPTLSALWGTGGGRNWGGYSSPEMDAALKVGLESDDAEERRAAYTTVQNLAIADVPDVWFIPFVYIQLRTPEVHGNTWAGWGVTLFDSIWLEQ